MKQTLHIFRKDVCHHWPEILVCLALLVAYARNEPSQWTQGLTAGEFNGLIDIALVISWCLLIVRVVQGESLTGDRQFWITRPYDWRSLLASKVLFVLTFLNVPLLPAQLYLLWRAEFRWTPSFIPGLLRMHLTLFLILLPVAVLATVTASVGQMVLTLLAIAGVIAGIRAVASYLPDQPLSSGSGGLQGLVLMAACLAVLILQYARRRTDLSRWLLVTVPVTILVIVVATPYRALIARDYPPGHPGQTQPLQLSVETATPKTQEFSPDWGDFVAIRLPLRVSGIAEGSFVRVEGKLLTVEAPGGLKWISGWKRESLLLTPDQQSAIPYFAVKKEFFERVKSAPAKIHLALAVSVLRGGDLKSVRAGEGEFAVPGGGICLVPRRDGAGVQCRFPLRLSSFMVETESSATTCPPSHDEPIVTGKTQRYWLGNSGAGLISPVLVESLYLQGRDGDKTRDAHICPGTPLVFGRSMPVEQLGLEIDTQGVRLGDYGTGDTPQSFRRMTVGR
jgi:hypothetical protein